MFSTKDSISGCKMRQVSDAPTPALTCGIGPDLKVAFVRRRVMFRMSTLNSNASYGVTKHKGRFHLPRKLSTHALGSGSISLMVRACSYVMPALGIRRDQTPYEL